MKRIMIFMLVAVMIVAMAGCQASSPSSDSGTGSSAGSSTEAPGEKPTIAYSSWSLVDEGWIPTMDEVFEVFNEQYGDQITLETGGNAYADTLNSLLIQGANGDGPDLVMVKSSWLPQLLELDCLTDFNDVLSEEVKNDIGSGLDAFTVDGKIIAIPYFTQGYGLFYNKDLLEQANVAVPTTFDELLAASKKISALGNDANGNKIYGLGLVNSGLEVAEGYNIFPWLWARGGDFVDSNDKVILDSPENQKAFQEIGELYASENSPKGLSYKEMRNLFATGDLGFFWDLASQVDSFVLASPLGEDFRSHVGAVPIPGAKAGDGVGYYDDVVFVSFKSCENIGAAATVAEFLSGPTTLQILYDHGKGKMSLRKSVMDSVFAQPADEITKAYVDAMDTSRSLPCLNLAFMDADKALMDSVTRLAIGDDPKTVLTDLDAQVKTLYGQ